MREKYESLPLATLRDLAKAREMTGVSTLKKAELIEAMLEQDEKDKLKNEKTELDIEQLDSGETVEGILEVMENGYGFIRSDNYLPGENDIYVSPSQIRRFGLKTGDIITYKVTLKNTISTEISGIELIDTIPAGTEFVSASEGVAAEESTVSWSYF